MKYNITIHREVIGKYWNHKTIKDDSNIKTIHHDEYTDLTFEILKDLLQQEIDPPKDLIPLTEEKVCEEFEYDPWNELSDESIKSIMTYYNSRLEMFNKIMKEIESENFKYISYSLTKDNDTFDVYSHDNLDEVYGNSYISVKRV